MYLPYHPNEISRSYDSTAKAASSSRQVSIVQNAINRLMATIMGLQICMKLQSIIHKLD